MLGSNDTGLGSIPTAANNTGGGGGGTVESVVAGTGISVNNADPTNPVVSNTGILSVSAGTGIGVTAGQNPTISNTKPSSLIYFPLFTQPAPSADFDCSGLSGQTDGDYEGFAEFTVDSGFGVLTLQPNAISDDQQCGTVFSVPGSSNPGCEERSDLLCAGVINDPVLIVVHFKLTAKAVSGRVRQFYSDYYTVTDLASASNNFRGSQSGIWNNDSTVITSLRFHYSAGQILTAELRLTASGNTT